MNEKKSLTLSQEQLMTFTMTALSFIVPFILSQQQLPTGIFVNALLFLAVLFLPASTRLPIIIFPSLAAAARGVVFGGLTTYILMFIPVIWIGNWLLTVVFDALQRHVGIVAAGIFAAMAKAISLSIAAVILVNMHVVPKLFLTTMGLMQLVTAMVGLVVALGVYYFVLSRRV